LAVFDHAVFTFVAFDTQVSGGESFFFFRGRHDLWEHAEFSTWDAALAVLPSFSTLLLFGSLGFGWQEKAAIFSLEGVKVINALDRTAQI
jgi:hypothetical protein